MKKLEKTAKEIIKAWESLEGDKRYSPHQIQKWLIEDMKPAIDKLRKELKLNHESGR